jgi:hypothetical protein
MIVCSNAGVFNHCADGVIRGILFHAHQCSCGCLTFFVVNRDGRSRCVDCDAEYEQRLTRHVNS